MNCAMRLHDPCAGEVRLRRVLNHEVPLCWRHVIRLHKGQPPFRWQTTEQLRRWVEDRARRQGAGQAPADRVRLTP